MHIQLDSILFGWFNNPKRHIAHSSQETKQKNNNVFFVMSSEVDRHREKVNFWMEKERNAVSAASRCNLLIVGAIPMQNNELFHISPPRPHIVAQMFPGELVSNRYMIHDWMNRAIFDGTSNDYYVSNECRDGKIPLLRFSQNVYSAHT